MSCLRYSKPLLLTLLSSLALLTVFSGCAGDPFTDDFYTNQSFIRIDASGNGGYWHEYNIDAFSTSPGSSGATRINVGASSLGGYRLDDISDYLNFTTHVDDDWDGIGDGVLDVYFEVNVDNSGGGAGDTVVLTMECYHKKEGELVNTVGNHEGSTVVGQATQHKLFKQTIPINDLRDGDVISFRLNLNTITGDVDNVIINYIEFKYPAFVSAVERN